MSPTFAVSPLSPDRAWARYRSWRSSVAVDARFFTGIGMCLWNGSSIFQREDAFQTILSSCVQDLDANVRLDLAAVDEGRPVGDDFLHLRAPAGKAGHARRAREHQGCDLPRE